MDLVHWNKNTQASKHNLSTHIQLQNSKMPIIKKNGI